MANFCLPKDRVSAFIKGIQSGEINPEELAQMSSEARRTTLAKYVGEFAAPKVNAEFESKLLLKNQQAGLVTWAKNVSGVKPQVRKDLIAKIQKIDRVLDPAEQDKFLADLAETKLGFAIDYNEAKAISELSQNVTQLESKRLPDGSFPTREDAMKYGYAAEDLSTFVGELKVKAEAIKPKDLLTLRGLGTGVSKVAGNMKSLTASMDNSAIFRQGWKTLITNPNIWRKNAADTFVTIAREIGGKNVLREVNADIISRPLYDKMMAAGLAVKKAEEAFPESAADKVPYLRRVYRASESAYTGFVYKMRADVFEKYYKMAEASGVNVNDPAQLKDIGKLVNSLTGRGYLGQAEKVAGTVNNIFFSPRFMKANIDTLTAHQLSQGVTPFVRKQAAINLLKIASTTAGILYTAEAIRPGSVDFDPRSTDFGKIKIGNTRFDVTGGMSSLVVLGARLLPTMHDGVWGQYAKTSTGKMTNLNDTAFGSRDQIDVLVDFIRNKFSPATSLAVNLATGKNSMGQPVDPLGAVIGATTPIGIQNIYQTAQDPNSAPLIAVIIADGLGISANNYAPIQKNAWQDSTSKELTSFKQKVGNDKFKEAGKKFEDQANAYINKVIKDPRYIALPDDQKQAVITKKKNQIQDEILKQYGFVYKAAKTDSSKINDLLK